MCGASARLSCPGRARKREEPGPRGGTTGHWPADVALRAFLRWVPDLVSLVQVHSLHSSGTRVCRMAIRVPYRRFASGMNSARLAALCSPSAGTAP